MLHILCIMALIIIYIVHIGLDTGGISRPLKHHSVSNRIYSEESTWNKIILVTIICILEQLRELVNMKLIIPNEP